MSDDSDWEWDDSDQDPISDTGQEKVPEPRDAVIDQAKIPLAKFFEEEKTGVFYQRQLQIIFERDFFHWITARALVELVAENVIAASSEVLPNVGSIRIYRKPKHRYWKRQANEVIQIVSKFSRSDFAHAMGAHAEMMFDAALPSVGFTPTGRDIRSYNGKVGLKQITIWIEYSSVTAWVTAPRLRTLWIISLEKKCASRSRCAGF